MARIKIVSFDMEGTLVDHTFSNLIWENDIPSLYGKKHDLSFEAAKKHVLSEYKKIGDNRPEWYDVDYWFKLLGLSRDWRKLLEKRREYCKVYPEALSVLNRLNAEYSLIISSNTIRDFLEIQLEKFPRIFTHVFSATSDFKKVKKSADFFTEICRILKLSPDSVVHVGDSLESDYEAPKKIGVNTYFLDRNRKAAGKHVVYDLLEFESRLGTN